MPRLRLGGRQFIKVLTAVILAGRASLGLLGNYTYFGVSKETISFVADWPLVLGCGVIGGGFGALFRCWR